MTYDAWKTTPPDQDRCMEPELDEEARRRRTSAPPSGLVMREDDIDF